MYREQDEDLKPSSRQSLESLHDNHPLRTDVERRDDGDAAECKASRAAAPGCDGASEQADADRGRGCHRDRSAAALSAFAGGWTAAISFRPTTPMCCAHNTTLASKISGYVDSVPVADNAPGQGRRCHRHHRRWRLSACGRCSARQGRDPAGDRRPHRPANRRPGRQLSIRPRRRLASAQADAKKTQLEFARQQALAKQQFASQQTLEQAEANRDQAAAAVQSAQSVIDAAKAISTCSRRSSGGGAHARRAEDRASASRARSVVHRDPRAGRRRLQQPRGADRRLRADRPAHREPGAARATSISTPISRRRSLPGSQPGQPVSISVDALPDDAIKGRVESLSPASGAVFSLLPPDNATGNFTKIVQRLPVRIAVPAASRRSACCGPGMSVVVSVDTKPGHAAAAGLTSAADAAEAAVASAQ